MSVVDGQPVSAAVTNPAFIKPDVDDYSVSRLGMRRATSPSGYYVQDIQRYINNVAQVIGLVYTGNYSAEADSTGNTYGSTSTIVTNGTTFKNAITNLANAFATTGHAHTGSGTDGAQIAASSLSGTISLTSQVTGTLPVANGGTGQTTLQAAINSLAGAVTSGQYLRGNGTNVVMNAIQAGDVPTLNQNTSGTAAGLSSTLVIGSGGTGQTTASAAFAALSPQTTKGDLVGFSTAPVTVGVGANNTILIADSTQAAGFKWGTPAAGSYTAPTVQKFTSGTGTYTTPSPTPLYLEVVMVGGGGGGGGSTTSGDAGGGGTGGNTTFGTSLLVANGGGGGTANATSTLNAGGTASLGSGPIGVALQGGSSTGPSQEQGTSSNMFIAGATGAASPFGGAGGGAAGNSVAGTAAIANSGSGGGGASITTGTSAKAGGGGAAGGWLRAIISSPSSTYSYAIGSGGTAGGAGTNGAAGGVGGSGLVLVFEHYQ